MMYVYILKSDEDCSIYVGVSSDLRNRLDAHNKGSVSHTRKHRPWHIAWYCAFVEKQKAFEFEKYLKQGTGRAHIHKRLL